MPQTPGVLCALSCARVPKGAGRDLPARSFKGKLHKRTVAMAEPGVKRNSMRFLQLLCIAGAFTSALTADNVVFNNISQPSPIRQEIQSYQPGYQPPLRFIHRYGERANHRSATCFESLHKWSNPCFTTDFTSGSFQVGVYADVPGASGNSHMPGAEIAVLATVSDSVLSTVPAVYNIPLAASPALSANTVYWIGLSGTTTDAEWSWTTTAGGPGLRPNISIIRLESMPTPAA